LNVPYFLKWIFWLFKPVLPAATLAKMKVVGSGPHTIGKELPQRYGGSVANAFRIPC
jgi:phosphatidylinositol transfer protein SFH5